MNEKKQAQKDIERKIEAENEKIKEIGSVKMRKLRIRIQGKNKESYCREKTTKM